MSEAATTYGWDVVFATRASVVNDGLARVGPQPFDEVVESEGISVRGRGETGRWQLAAGGSGALVNFTVPCPALTLSHSGKSAGFADGKFLIQCALSLQPPAAGDAAGGGRSELVVPAGPGAVTVLLAAFGQAGFGEFEVYAKAAFQAWLDAQPSFPYVLAEVDLSGPDGGGLGRALAPVTASYAYADDPAGGGVLGILSTVEGGAAPGAPLLQEVWPGAVSEADTVVLVSAQIMRRLAGGAGASVTLPGTSGSACRVAAASCFPVVTQART